MKTIQIGKLKVKVAENANDINIQRFVAMKEYVIAKETGIDRPTLTSTFKQIYQNFNKNDSAGTLIAIYDFINGLANIEKQQDAHQMIFALLTLEENEDETNTDKTFLKEKLDRLAKQGLKQGTVEEYSENFIIASFGR
jgi:hypothetical protein